MDPIWTTTPRYTNNRQSSKVMLKLNITFLNNIKTYDILVLIFRVVFNYKNVLTELCNVKVFVPNDKL